MSWLKATHHTIEQVHKTLPSNVDEETCRKALSAAYPFGERSMSPYKTWCHNVQNYLIQRFPNGAAAKRRLKTETARRERRFVALPTPELGSDETRQEAMEL